MIIHSLEQGLAALSQGGEAITLESPPGAAGHHGIGWWLALIRILRQERPLAEFEAVLDCGDSPGLALEAIEAGVPIIRVGGLSPDMIGRLRAMAALSGSLIR